MGTGTTNQTLGHFAVRIPTKWLVVINDGSRTLEPFFIERLSDEQLHAYEKRIMALGLKYTFYNLDAIDTLYATLDEWLTYEERKQP